MTRQASATVAQRNAAVIPRIQALAEQVRQGIPEALSLTATISRTPLQHG
jgi:hypothetical protein